MLRCTKEKPAGLCWEKVTIPRCNIVGSGLGVGVGLGTELGDACAGFIYFWYIISAFVLIMIIHYRDAYVLWVAYIKSRLSNIDLHRWNKTGWSRQSRNSRATVLCNWQDVRHLCRFISCSAITNKNYTLVLLALVRAETIATSVIPWKYKVCLIQNTAKRTRALFLARSKLRLCSANHRPGYWRNLPCDWPSTAWGYSEQETENGPRYLTISV